MTQTLLRTVDETSVNPGLLGFVVVALLGVATWLLLRSMLRHLNRIEVPREEAPDDAQPEE